MVDLSPEDEEAVEEAARRIVELQRLREEGETRQGAPSPTPLEILEEHTGGEFTPETARLAERTLVRARKLEGRRGSLGAVPESRQKSRVEEFGSRKGGEIVSRL